MIEVETPVDRTHQQPLQTGTVGLDEGRLDHLLRQRRDPHEVLSDLPHLDLKEELLREKLPVFLGRFASVLLLSMLVTSIILH